MSKVDVVLKILEGFPSVLDQQRRKGFTVSELDHFLDGYISALVDYLRINLDDEV